MHKPESIQENEVHETLWDFEIQTGYQILARRPDIVLVNKKKKNLLLSRLGHFSRSSRENKRKWKHRQILEYLLTNTHCKDILVRIYVECYVSSSLYLKVNKCVKNQDVEKFLW